MIISVVPGAAIATGLPKLGALLDRPLLILERIRGGRATATSWPAYRCLVQSTAEPLEGTSLKGRPA
jgi:hypothetical protein